MVNKLKASADNAMILDYIRKDATVDYRRRIPSATQGSVEATMKTLYDSKTYRNEFIDQLINKIGLTLFNQTQWANPLGIFKRPNLPFGSTIEEITMGLVKATPYSSDRDSLEGELFGRETPDVSVQYHTVNRKDKYKITVDQPNLRNAFTSGDGLATFISELMEVSQTSDNWDEFLLMTNLISEVHQNNGFHKVQVGNVGDAGSTEADAKYMLRRVREHAAKLSFMSSRYNPLGKPTAVNREDLVLFVTPEANAAMDVEALAGAFNMESAKVGTRIIEIPEENFGINGAQGFLTTGKFFVVADQLTETTVQPNAAGLYDNYYLHHWQVMSASLAAPGILFTTDVGTTINLYDTEVTAINVTTLRDRVGVAVTSVERGELYDIESVLTVVPEDNGSDPRWFTVEGATSQLTYIRGSVLHVGATEESESLSVIGHSSDGNSEVTGTLTVSVYGDLLILQPAEVVPDVDNDGLNEVTPEPLTVDAAGNVAIPTVTGVQYKREGVNVSNGSIETITIATTFTAVARANFELVTGATASWTLTP